MFDRLGDLLVALWYTTAVMLAVFVPLGMWKLVDIVLWLVRHVQIGVNP